MAVGSHGLNTQMRMKISFFVSFRKAYKRNIPQKKNASPSPGGHMIRARSKFGGQ